MASNTQIIIVLLFCGFALFSLGWIANDIYWTVNDIKKKAGANQQSKLTKNSIPKQSLKSKLICCYIACKYNSNGACGRDVLTIGMDGTCNDKWSAFDEFV